MLTRLKRVGILIMNVAIVLAVIAAFLAVVSGLFWLDKLRFCV